MVTDLLLSFLEQCDLPAELQEPHERYDKLS